MTGARAAVDGTSTEAPPRSGTGRSTPASTIGPWLPEGALGASLADGLVRVESALTDAVGSEHPFVREAAGHLMSAGGKRFRPMLALLAAQLGDPTAPEVIRAAVVCELTHLATLYHDDVMDEAAVRRGAPSANSRWTNSIAILTGDLLFARASDLLADLGPDAVRIQAQTFERLVTGQIKETVGAAARRGPDRALPRRAGRQDRLAGGHLRPLRRELRRRRGVPGRGADRVRRGGRASPSRSPTTCSTSSARAARPGSRPAPTCARASPPCRRCSPSPATTRPRRGCASSWPPRSATTTTTPRRSTLLRSSRSLARANEVLAQYADRARARLDRGARRATSATRCRRCATTWSPAPADGACWTCARLRAGSRRGPAWPAALLAGCTSSPSPSASGRPTPPGAPALDVAVVADGLDHPWDVAQAPDGTLLFDERAGGFTAVLPDGTVQDGARPTSTTCSPAARPG